jgi:hypothetical protein
MSEKRIVLGGPAQPMTRQDKRWAELAAKRELEALANIRGLAEKWAASLTGALGVVGLAALLDKSATFAKLDDPWKGIAEVSFVLAVVLALVSTVFAVMAAQGTAKRYFIPAGTALKHYSEESVKAALWQLRLSRTIAAVAAAAFLLAGSMLWFGDKAASSPTVIELPAGTQLCDGAAPPPKDSDAGYQVRCGGEK